MSLWENRNFGVMLLKEVNKLIQSKEYFYEIKFDGIRACIFGNSKEIKIISRNKKDITYLFPELQCLKKIFKKDTILDGEIICLKDGQISFETVSDRLHLKNINKITNIANVNPAIYVAFDVLYYEKDIIDYKIEDRKKLLNRFKDNDFFMKSKVYDDSVKLFNFVKDNNMEGIVAKEKNSKYLINMRSDNWIKIKNYMIDDFYIGGYEVKKGNYISLKLGEYIDNKFVYVGSVSLIKSNKLYDKVISLKKIKNSPFNNYDENIYYVNVILKCKVKYIHKTKNNLLRQPVIVRGRI